MKNIKSAMNILKDRERVPNKREKSGFWKRLTFWYLNHTFKTGYKRPLNKHDIFSISKEHSAEALNSQLERLWESELERQDVGGKPSFARCIVKFAVSMFGWLAIVGFFHIVFRMIQTYFLKFLIQSLSEKDSSHTGFCWAAALWLSMVAGWFTHHKFYYIGSVSGAAIKSAVISLIYRKVLRLSNGSLNKLSTGHVITLVSSDAHKLEFLCKFAHYIWIGPVMFVFVAAILWNNFGLPSLAAIAVICLSATMQSLLGRYFANVRVKTVSNTDKRVSTMNEVISSMQVTKMYNWEKSFAEKIHATRKIESRFIMKAEFVRSVNKAMSNSVPHLVALAVLGTFYAVGGELTLPVVFQTIAVMYMSRYEIIEMFPTVIQLIMEAYVGCKRLEKLLLHEEMPTNQLSYSPEDSSSKLGVIFENVSARYDDTEKPVFDEISFSCNLKNNLVMVVGPVGSGKSSILMAALKELKVEKGSVKVNGSIAYAAQQPWVFSGTVRQNILFGKEYNKERYKKVIKACALTTDIKSLDNGDMTLIGEKGVTLSGGQKARIGLARAVYHDADIYMLDDPLSAVDAKVGKEIFQQCIQGLLKDKVVLLVTHQIQYLKYATDIICLENGTASEGTLKDFMTRGVDLETFLSVEDDKEQVEDVKDSMSKSMVSLNSLTSAHESLPVDDEEKSRKTGGIPLRLYYDYVFKSLGWCTAILVIAGMVVSQVSNSFTDVFLGEWAKSEEEARSNITISSKLYLKENPVWNLYIFTILVLFNTFTGVLKAFVFSISLVKCSRYLHDKMFTAVVKAPLYFFDTNPVGQILNRFSRDIYLMDEELPFMFYDVCYRTFMILSIIALNCISIPYLLILFVPLLVIFLLFRNFYLTSAREIKRLEATSRSPLYTHLSATLAGLSSIRSFNLVGTLFHDFLECIDYQVEAYITFLDSVRWFGQRLDSLAIFFNFFAIFSPVLAVKYGDIDPAVAGVGLTYCLSLCGFLQYCVRQSAELESLMVSTERVYEYSKLKPEPDQGLSEDLPKQWPHQGQITACNACYAYHETLPNVLNKLNFVIKPKEKIGIVGRTGAGKSSLLNMLFRFGVNTGEIRIDGRNIAELKLEDLRSSISVIPQDPVLFGGTLRRNLDPFSNYVDEDIWDALDKVQMKLVVTEFENKLETEIKESGSNLSVGERQLLCLARALLKKNKILVIDEATANVDFETDAVIQRTIREKFKECTVLTIAHRLNTIMDSDRIMVLDAGDIVEFDAPYKLLQMESGFLKKLVEQTGEQESSKLKGQARNARKIDSKNESDGKNKKEKEVPKDGELESTVFFDENDDSANETEKLLSREIRT